MIHTEILWYGPDTTTKGDKAIVHDLNHYYYFAIDL